jgi:hypothetical protein
MELFESRDKIKALVMAKFLVTDATRKMESLVIMLSVVFEVYRVVSLNFRLPALKVKIGTEDDACTTATLSPSRVTLSS